MPLCPLQSSEAYAEHVDHLAGHRDDIDPEVVERLERGRDTPAWQYLRATSRRHDLREMAGEMFGRFDVLAMPTVPVIATQPFPISNDALALAVCAADSVDATN